MAFWKDVREDIQTVLKKDPAARNSLEVLLCYPGIWALIWHKPAHFLYKHNIKLLARMISQLTRFFTGIEIHPGATIGRRCFIDHGMAVVIGETTEIGDDVTLYQGVTLGGTGKETGKRHPTIGDNVMISAGAKIIGSFTVGENSKIGAGSVVIGEVPPNCTVVGVPGRIVKRDNIKIPRSDMDQVHLPDPVKEDITVLQQENSALVNRVLKLEETMRALAPKEERAALPKEKQMTEQKTGR